MKLATRLREPAIALLMFQVLLTAPGLPEFVYDHSPSLIGVAGSVLIALAWLGIAVWAGLRGWRAFVGLTLTFWGLAMIMSLLVMWVAGSDATLPGHQVLLLLMFIIGPPLHGLTPLVPIEDQAMRYLVTAAGLLSLTIATYLTTRKLARPTIPRAAADRRSS